MLDNMETKYINAESFINYLNSQFFFKEFTYFINKFRDANRQEKQVTDCLLWLDDIMVFFQIKERMLYDIKFEKPSVTENQPGVLYIYQDDSGCKLAYQLTTFDGKHVKDDNLSDLKLGKEIKNKIQESSPVFSKEEKNSILRAISKKHILPKMTFSEESYESAKKWFDKVIDIAKKQIEKDILYFNESKSIHLTNNNGHGFNVDINGKLIHKIIVYSTKHLLPIEQSSKKYSLTAVSEVIHIFSVESYDLTVKVLITPAEIVEYLFFREQLIRKFGSRLKQIKEIAILGQFISDNLESDPSNNFELYVRKLIYKTEISTIAFLMKIFSEKTFYSTNFRGNDQYFILKELAKLRREEIYVFSEKIRLAITSVIEKKFPAPWRFAIDRLNCGFVFISSEEKNSKEYLEVYTRLLKYDTKSQKCIGFAVYPEKGGHLIFMWSYLDEPWIEDKEISDLIKTNPPFRESQYRYLTRYHFADSAKLDLP